MPDQEKMQRIVAGRPLGELWSAEDNDPESELMTLTELSSTLRQRGIIKRSPQALYLWSSRGCSVCWDKETRVYLRTMMVGKYAHSTVRWVKDFLKAQMSES